MTDDGTGNFFAEDAKSIAPGDAPGLREERDGGGPGRVYLIVATGTAQGGGTGFACTSVVVPHDPEQGLSECRECDGKRGGEQLQGHWTTTGGVRTSGYHSISEAIQHVTKHLDSPLRLPARLFERTRTGRRESPGPAI